ncbi:MAG: amino acid permease [Pseudomonadota bacterium]
MQLQHRFSARTATAVIVANMIGTGVFTSLGFQLLELDSPFVLLSLWIVGGFIALSGALSYAELGAALPRSGGEYHFLSTIIHPSVGFVSGWISATLGFAGPVALAAKTFAAYASSSLPILAGRSTETALAIGLIIALTVMHSLNRQTSGVAQQAFTAIKILVIIGFCGAALVFADSSQPISFLPSSGDAQMMTTGAYAISLIYVSYAYTGWNVATYVTSELEHPQRDVPRSLLAGSLIVTVLYVALNAVFLLSAPADAMRGEPEIGYIVARFVFGETGAQLTGLILAVLLVSTVSAMTLAGPRVLQVIGEDFPLFRGLGKTNSAGVPARAICVQSTIACLLCLLSSFEFLLLVSGIVLAISSFATVLSVYVLRAQRPDLPRPFRIPGYPFTPCVYLGIVGFALVYSAIDAPWAAATALLVVVTGLIVYFAQPRQDRAAAESGTASQAMP